MLIKPLTTKAYDRRASGDCGTSGCTWDDRAFPISLVVFGSSKDLSFASLVMVSKCKCRLVQVVY